MTSSGIMDSPVTGMVRGLDPLVTIGIPISNFMGFCGLVQISTSTPPPAGMWPLSGITCILRSLFSESPSLDCQSILKKPSDVPWFFSSKCLS